jgi:hypothetical protein
MHKYVAMFVLLIACGRPAAEVESAAPSAAPEIEVVGVEDDTPPGGDGVPRLRLAFRFADGARVPIAGEAVAYAAFRDGVALVDVERQLVLVSSDGSRRVLARASGAPPVRGPQGELVYVARHGLIAEVHVLDARGGDRIVASELSNAGVLAPQADGRLFFVAARRGGVAGVWVAEHGTARCLSNCELTTGTPWAGRFLPLPRDAGSIRASADRVEWDASDGTQRSAALAASASARDGDEAPPRSDGDVPVKDVGTDEGAGALRAPAEEHTP